MNFKSFFDSIFFTAIVTPFKASNYIKLHNSVIKIYNSDDVEQKPIPITGLNSLYDLWSESVSKEFKNFSESSINYTFIVNHSGELSDIECTGTTDISLNKKLVTLSKNLSIKWQPGTIVNKTVRVKMDLELEYQQKFSY